MMHWLDGRPDPHRREKEWCAGCRLGQTPQWKGFLGVISTRTMNRFVLQIPPAAFRNSGLFKEKSDAGLLAGVLFTGHRFGEYKCKNSPARIVLVDQVVPHPKSHPFPLLGALARYWNMESLDVCDQVPNPEEWSDERKEWRARYEAQQAAARRKRKEVK
jgi:hypothetical protein